MGKNGQLSFLYPSGLVGHSLFILGGALEQQFVGDEDAIRPHCPVMIAWASFLSRSGLTHYIRPGGATGTGRRPRRAAPGQSALGIDFLVIAGDVRHGEGQRQRLCGS